MSSRLVEHSIDILLLIYNIEINECNTRIEELITGIELTVRPVKIVSGQEPTKTNELLQAIAKALDKNVTSFSFSRFFFFFQL